jgi:hypothetical protein
MESQKKGIEMKFIVILAVGLLLLGTAQRAHAEEEGPQALFCPYIGTEAEGQVFEPAQINLLAVMGALTVDAYLSELENGEPGEGVVTLIEHLISSEECELTEREDVGFVYDEPCIKAGAECFLVGEATMVRDGQKYYGQAIMLPLDSADEPPAATDEPDAVSSNGDSKLARLCEEVQVQATAVTIDDGNCVSE